MKLCVLLAAAAMAVGGCSGARSALDLKSPATMRAVLSASASAILDADKLCGEVALAMSTEAKPRGDLPRMRQALELATACEAEYQHAREALLVAQAVLDIYETAHEGRIACAAVEAFDALKHLESLVAAVTVRPMPQSVRDAEALAQQLVAALVAPMCPVPVRHADAGVDADADATNDAADAAEGG